MSKKHKHPEENVTEHAEDANGGVEADAQVPVVVDELEAERARADENYDRYLRAVADLDNFRKRTRQEMEEFRKYAAEDLVIELLGVIDNLQRALESTQGNGDVSALTQGVSLTLRQMMDILEARGLKEIEAEGHMFDPNLHEAVLRVDAEPDMDNVIVEELTRGYTLHGRVLRPAVVKVGVHSDSKTIGEDES